MCQELHDKAKNIVKQETWMKFYDTSKPQFLVADTSGISLGDGLLQVRDDMNYR